MTLYANETAQIKITAVDFDQSTALSSAEVVTVNVTIFNREGDEVLGTTEIDYYVDEEAWIYNWDTTGRDPGSYRAKIEAYGIGATPPYSLEFKRIRLNRRPVGG
jgi:hypothetical protein